LKGIGPVTHQLVSKEENSLEGKFAVTEVEQILEGRSEKVEDHCIIIAFGTKPSDERNTYTSSQSLVDFRFVL
jgi:hypothetical protein